MKRLIFPLIILMAVLGGCSSKASRDTEPLTVERLDHAVEKGELADSLRPGMKLYLGVLGIACTDEALDDCVDALRHNRLIEVFGPDVDQRLGDLAPIEATLGEARETLAKVAPKARMDRVYGVISPYRQGVVTTDSAALIALNLYLGEDYLGYEGFEQYFRQSRVKERIPYDVVEAVVAAGYPQDDARPLTLLQRMLYQGALVHATVESLPNASLATAIGVSDEQLKWFNQNEHNIWQALISRNLLYSTDDLEASRLIAPGPGCFALNADCPARVGRYIGYRITQSYLERHPDATPEDLLSTSFYLGSSTLLDSRYNP
ncbi:MAG: hypothetical protein LIP02_13545 [Bacteroidales bacterium]|nr:hypothetical protein [Bacteroidales bacterium]